MKHGSLMALIIGLSLLSSCQSRETNHKPETQGAGKPSQMDEGGRWTASGLNEMSLPELSTALSDGKATSEDLVKASLKRIEQLDRKGPRLQTIITLNPDALDEARRLDKLRQDGTVLGPLHGIPILLKDNIDSLDAMPTTAGAIALKDNVTGRDSPLVAGLRAEGAVILGKTNLTQWANFRSDFAMSGWSALGGQVRNPQMLDRNPCGSSSGSGAAVAAGLVAGAVGTETNGSIICPSNANGIVGFKPTVGLVPQTYIIPISHTQDTAGPMTQTVRGAAMMLSAMAVDDDQEFEALLDAGSLQGKRIGVLRFAEGSNPNIIARFNAALKDLEALGATLVEIEEFTPDMKDYGARTYALLRYEFKAGVNDYLENSPADIPVRSLADLIKFNDAHADTELSLFDQSIFIESEAMGPLTDEAYLSAKADMLAATQANGLDKLMRENQVDVLVSPSGPVPGRIDAINGDVWPSWAGAGGLAARAGYPHLTVPMGDIHGLSIGLSFFGLAGEDAKVLSYGYAYEQVTHHRRAAAFLKSAADRPEINSALLGFAEGNNSK